MPKLLFSGLTETHEILLKSLFEWLGYESDRLPLPDNEALKTGKIYCNKGQCNPVYYTAGNLINYLRSLREKGEEDIEKKYAYITAGSCGPCRFGMYELEYRKALSEAGFRDFRVIAVQQGDAMLKDLQEIGFSLERKYFFRLLKPLLLGDIINNIYYKIKPYENLPGSADTWREGAARMLSVSLKEGMPVHSALKKIKKELDSIEVDYLKPKPKVKITGEFFSQTQEGDANYRLPGWLIEEGAEPMVEPMMTWVDYLIWEKKKFTKERFFRSRKTALKIIVLISMLKSLIHNHYHYYRFLLGFKPDPLTSQSKIAALAHPYYNTKLTGGEGHLEVGKHIYAMKHHTANMVISVKPFGCMPSTQSDGVQTKVTGDLKESLFVSIDTSGDAEVNVKSRLLMKLYEARIKAFEEYDRVKKGLGFTESKIEERIAQKPRVKRASLLLPHRCTTTAGNALFYLAG